MAARPKMSLKHAGNTVVGFFATGLLRIVRFTNPDWLSNVCGALLRRIGPRLKEHQIGRANLAVAFPEKSPEEIERILRDVWENLGRFAAEFAHLDRLWDADLSRPGDKRITWSQAAHERAVRLKEMGKPALVFAAHIGNWELVAVGAHSVGFKSAVLYRRPNIIAVADAAIEIRSRIMGTLIPTDYMAPIKIAEAIERGNHIGMLVDQYHTRGIDVNFFGRPARTNALIARLARQFDCQIYGMYAIRRPGGRFQMELTEPIDAPRDAEGRIDVGGTMQRINDVVEGWVRENPEQWLWVHRRWR